MADIFCSQEEANKANMQLNAHENFTWYHMITSGLECTATHLNFCPGFRPFYLVVLQAYNLLIAYYINDREKEGENVMVNSSSSTLGHEDTLYTAPRH